MGVQFPPEAPGALEGVARGPISPGEIGTFVPKQSLAHKHSLTFVLVLVGARIKRLAGARSFGPARFARGPIKSDDNRTFCTQTEVWAHKNLPAAEPCDPKLTFGPIAQLAEQPALNR